MFSDTPFLTGAGWGKQARVIVNIGFSDNLTCEQSYIMFANADNMHYICLYMETL